MKGIITPSSGCLKITLKAQSKDVYKRQVYNEEMIDDALSRFERVFANVGLKEN